MRSLVTIDDLTETEIQAIFSLADEFLATMATPDKPFRVRGRTKLAEHLVLATLFYEASTRTRFSFESAMLRLGGQVLSSADPKTTSAAKGETLADTVRVVQNYADLIVIRHPNEGAVRVAADYADIPIINAGDGGHEHPTQTLCDLYTLQREKGTLRNLNVVLSGDLKHGRTVHSLVYGLARFGARIIPMPAPGLGLPEHVTRRLLRDYDCAPVSENNLEDLRGDEFPVDVVYCTPDKPHQRSLFTGLEAEDTPPESVKLPHNAFSRIDAWYVTRLQKERLRESGPEGYPVMNAGFLKNRRHKHTSVMHPLPRVEELAYEFDSDERAVYFKQASYGVPVRMALIAALFHLKPGLLQEEHPGHKHLLYQQPTINCSNPSCVLTQENEQRYLRPKFFVIPEDHRLLLRCVYCEHELVPEFVARKSTHKCQANHKAWEKLPDDLMFFASAEAAQAGGFDPLPVTVSV